MIKYKDGHIDERIILSVVNCGQYHDSIKVNFLNGEEEMLFDFYPCYDGTDPIIVSVDKLKDISEIVIDAPQAEIDKYENAIGAKAREEYEKNRGIMKDDICAIVKGRKYPHGTVIKVLKIIKDDWGKTNALFLNDDESKGKWGKTNVENLKVIDNDITKASIMNSAIVKTRNIILPREVTGIDRANYNFKIYRKEKISL